jgi:hypothetical protein
MPLYALPSIVQVVTPNMDSASEKHWSLKASNWFTNGAKCQNKSGTLSDAAHFTPHEETVC